MVHHLLESADGVDVGEFDLVGGLGPLEVDQSIS